MPYMRLFTSGLSVDIAPLIEEIKWSENDLDSPNSGRTLDGLMHRGKVTSKRRADVKLLPSRASVINSILQILRHEYFYCETDLVPADNSVILMQMYNSTRSGGIQIVNTDNIVMHKDVAFNMIER